MDCIDHRWGDRFPVRIEVEVSCDSRRLGSGRLVDVSISGACLEMRNPPPVLSLVRIALPIPPDLDNGTHMAMACVVRSAEGRAGIEWCELAPPLARRILARASLPERPISEFEWEAVHGRAS